jgi:hypothetical protein
MMNSSLPVAAIEMFPPAAMVEIGRDIPETETGLNFFLS